MCSLRSLQGRKPMYSVSKNIRNSASQKGGNLKLTLDSCPLISTWVMWHTCACIHIYTCIYTYTHLHMITLSHKHEEIESEYMILDTFCIVKFSRKLLNIFHPSYTQRKLGSVQMNKQFLLTRKKWSTSYEYAKWDNCYILIKATDENFRETIRYVKSTRFYKY